MCNKCNQNFPFANMRDFDQIVDQEHSASDDMRLFFRSLNDLSNQKSRKEEHDSDPVIDCKYIDINSFNTIKFQQKSFNILHLNIASLGAHKEELEAVLSSLDHDFDVIGLSETKIKKDVVPNYDVDIRGYKTFSTPSHANKGGVIL